METAGDRPGRKILIVQEFRVQEARGQTPEEGSDPVPPSAACHLVALIFRAAAKPLLSSDFEIFQVVRWPATTSGGNSEAARHIQL